MRGAALGVSLHVQCNGVVSSTTTIAVPHVKDANCLRDIQETGAIWG